MKRILAFILFLVVLFVPLSVYNESDPATSTDLDPVRYEYVIKRNNLPKYNIVAFGDVSLNGHIRGSVYVGGTLTGTQFIDDGAIDGEAASDSYVYNNESNATFRGRTAEQSKDAYIALAKVSVEKTATYWKNFISNLPENNGTYIYLQPDEDGVVNITPYDYQAGDSDIAYRTIEKIYWTDATIVNMGGLAGHLIAPYATVNITWCNHCGSIVAQNIYTNGEAHINAFIPPPIEDEPPEPVDVTINKTLIGSVWHVRCDVMDGTTFKAGGGYWKTDVIKNPAGITSKEGHRSNKCGNADNWVIWVDDNGVPFRMDEIKSGATGGTLPTILFRPRYNLTTDEIIHMEPTDTELVWRWSQNFQDPMNYSEIVPGERIYWITWNGNQRWYHSGIPYKVGAPTYTIYIDGEGYNLVANSGSITIEDLEQGIHTIVEENYPDSYVSNIYINGVALSNYDGSINITADTNITVENTLITPPPKDSPTPPSPPVVVTPTPTPEEVTPTPTPEEETPTPIPDEETPTPTPDESTPTPTPVEETPTQTPSESTPTATFNEETPTPIKETPTITPDKETPTPTPEEETPTITPNEQTPTPTPAQETPTSTPVHETPTQTPPEETPTSSEETPTITPSKETPTITPIEETPTITPVEETPTATPSETPTATPTVTPAEETPTVTPPSTETPSPTPSPTPNITESPSPTPEVSETPIQELYCSITIEKKVINPTGDEAIFFFEISGSGLEEPLYEEIIVNENGIGKITLPEMRAGKYTIREIDIAEEYEVLEESITLYFINECTVLFENKHIDKSTLSPTPEITITPSPTPEITATPSPTPEVTATPSPTPEVTASPSPTPEITTTPSPTPEITETPTVSPTPTAVVTETPTPSPTPTAVVTETPTPSPTPIPMINISVHKEWQDEGYETVRPKTVSVRLYSNKKIVSTVILSESNNWTATYTAPKYDETGVEIAYIWREITVPGYYEKGTTVQNNLTTIINHIYTIPEIPMDGDKKPPKIPGKHITIVNLDEYATALGGETIINHVGDCFD